MGADVTIAMAQINPVVGDIAGNAERIQQAAREAAASGARLVMFPELALTGYPPEDLLLRPSLEIRVDKALQALAAQSTDIALLMGLPLHADGIASPTTGCSTKCAISRRALRPLFLNWTV